MELEKYRVYSEMARGIRKAPLVFKNANVFYWNYIMYFLWMMRQMYSLP